MTRFGSIILVLLVTMVVPSTTTTNKPGFFFPLGEVNVKNVKYLNGSETSGPIQLAHPFTLFGQTTNQINVNQNGILSFPSPMLESMPRKISHIGNENFVAVFHTDNMPLYGNGHIMYREHTSENDLEVKWAESLVNNHFSCYSGFKADNVFIASYHDVHTRYDCVLAHSIVYCTCLVSDAHYGNAAFCKCRESHSENYCGECDMGSSGQTTDISSLFCDCLDTKDDLDYCRCKEDKRNGIARECKCLRDHDAKYCDCLETSNNPEYAWNCSCAAKHPEVMCQCLREHNENKAFCDCYVFHYRADRMPCDCYLSRSKQFCDCYYAHNGMEGYCDCLEQGKPDAMCECIQFNHLSMFDDVYLAEKYCECTFSNGGGVIRNTPHTLSQHCRCIAEGGSEQSCPSRTKRRPPGGYVTCYERLRYRFLDKEEGCTYQVALITGGGMSFVVFNYGYFSKSMTNNYDSADYPYHHYWLNIDFRSAVFARSPKLIYEVEKESPPKSPIRDPWCLLWESSHKEPGQFIYRVDQQDIVKPDCITVQAETVNRIRPYDAPWK